MSKISASESKMLSLQQQMRQNNEDLKNFMKDLDSWEADIKHKDVELKSHKAVKETALPPVRNSLEKKKKKKVAKQNEGSPGSGKQKRISSYDYRAWDRFDVEKACDDVDETQEGSSSDYETDEEWEVERKKQAAIMEKDKGNDYFKQGDYDNAIECYTKGAELDPTNPLLPANRAMALLKQKKYAAAEIDCTVSLSLDPLYTKAYLRRGSARIGLKKYLAAKEDYERVLSLEPQNKKAKSDLETIEKELSKANLVTHSEIETAKDVGIVKAIFKAPEQRSKKPLKRIHIEEVGLDDDQDRRSAIAKVEQGQGQAKKELMEKDSHMFERFTAKSPADIGRLNIESDIEHKDRPVRNGFDTGHETNIVSKPITKVCDSFEQNGQAVSESKSGKTTSPDTITAKMKQAYSSVSKKTDSIKTEVPCHGNQGDRERSKVSSPRGQGQVSPREKTVPTTSFQFQADYKSLKHNSEGFYNYLKKIPPSEYTKLFGEFLDAEVLLKVLHAFREFHVQNDEDFYQAMKCLPDVKRFSMTVMFFSNKEKQVIRELMEHLRRSGQYSDSDLNSLATKYELT